MTRTDKIDPIALSRYIERIEQLEEEVANIREDMRQVFAEAKGAGYDPKIMKVVLRLKKMDTADRIVLDEDTKEYRDALNV